ncbi:hypothetical protein NX059_008526 [Plenodomus lindquistii]|nr:hypothetical protein NX059_008526 [Plenodomus lindquistii]
MSIRTCPHDKDQDGVCGCPEFWKHAKAKGSASKSTSRPPTTTPTRTTKDTNNMRSPSPTPSGGPKETCFFWYHGQCRRGDQCQFQHKTHITWPIVPPPGYVHYKPCVLPFCPLNSNQVSLNEQNAQRRKDLGLGGQVDGAFMSRTTTVEADSDQEKDTWQQDLEATVSTASISDLSDIADEFHDAREAVAVNATIEQEGVDQRISALSSPTPTSEIESLDMSGIVSPPPASEIGTERIVSLSHSGTIAKRRRASPSQSGLTGHLPYKPGPGITIGWESKPTDFAVQLSRQPQTAFDPPKAPRALLDGTATPQGAPDICFYYYHYGNCVPKSHRGRTLVCKFSHTEPGPGSKVKRPHNIGNHNVNCSLPLCPIRMAHEDWMQKNPWEPSGSEGPTLKIEPHEGTGPGISFHQGFSNAGWSNLRTQDDMTSNHLTTGRDAEVINKEQRTPLKCEPDFSGSPYSSSPRDAITAARYMSTKGPTFNKHSRDRRALQLPKITGLARERFKEQKSRIEKWQAENGITRDDKEARFLNKQQRKLMKNQRKRQKRIKRRQDAPPEVTHEEDTANSDKGRAIITDERQASRDTELHRTGFRSGIFSPEVTGAPDGIKNDGGPNTATKRAKRKGSSKNLRRSQRARSFFQNGMGNREVVGSFDPEAELYSKSLHPISEFPESTMERNIRNEREAKGRSVEIAMQGIETMRSSRGMSGTPSNGLLAANGKQPVDKADVRSTAEPAPKKYSILVDYHLPMSDDRLDWDTDLVRWTFGEIG